MTRSPPRHVSVIVPCYNAADTIGEQLKALSRQTYRGSWELIVSDNGSTDGTLDVARSYTRLFPSFRVVEATSRRGSAHARNVGVSVAEGHLLCFCDADDVVSKGWIEALVEMARDYDVVTGPLEIERLNGIKAKRGRAPRNLPPPEQIEFAPSGNFGVWADRMHDLGGFREDYLKAHDVELGIRMRRAGMRIGWSPNAIVHYRYRATYRSIVRQSYRSGRAQAQLRFDYPEEVQPLSPVGSQALWLAVRVPYLIFSSRRTFWLRKAAEMMGILSYRLRHDRRRPTGGNA